MGEALLHLAGHGMERLRKMKRKWHGRDRKDRKFGFVCKVHEP